VLKHPENAPLPEMTRPDVAFQKYDIAGSAYQHRYVVPGPIYLGRRDPLELVRVVLDARRAAARASGRQPTAILIDLPCTLFMMDVRSVPVVQEVASLVPFAPAIAVRMHCVF
jgi:hypothetical protein